MKGLHPIRPPFPPCKATRWFLLAAMAVLGFAPKAQAQSLDQLYQQAGTAIQEGRLQDAAGLFQQAAQLSPEEEGPLIGLGYVLTRMGQLDQALAVLDRALAINPNSSEAHTNMGFAHWTLGNRERAVMEYGIATRLDPSNVQALYNLGNSYSVMGSPGQALAPLERVLQLQPNHVDALVTLGAARVNLGDPAGAVLPLRQALSLAPTRPDVRYNLGLALGRTGDLAGAAKEHEWLQSNGPELAAMLHDQLGDAMVRAHRIQEGLPRPTPPPQAETDPSITLLGNSAGEGMTSWDEAGAEDAIVGNWYGEFKENGGPTPLGEATLSIAKMGPGTYQVRVTSGWIKTDRQEDAPYYSGGILRFVEKGQDLRGETIFRYEGESGAFYRNGAPKLVRITLQPGYRQPHVNANIAGATTTGLNGLVRMEGGI